MMRKAVEKKCITCNSIMILEVKETFGVTCYSCPECHSLCMSHDRVKMNRSLKQSLPLEEHSHRNARVRKAWLNRRKEIVTPQSCCEVCGISSTKTSLQIHHLDKSAYSPEYFHLYETISPFLPFILICKKCHFASHNGLELCQLCEKYYKKKGRDYCFRCAIGKGDVNACQCGVYKIKEKDFCGGSFCLGWLF
jgi:hypothetical protein